MSNTLKSIIFEYADVWKMISRRRKHQLILLLFLSILSAIAEVGNLGILLPFLKVLANPEAFLKGTYGFGGWFTLSWSRQSLILVLGSLFLVIVTISAALRAVTTYGHLKLTALLGADIGKSVLANILDRPYSWHIRQNSSEIIGSLTKDIDLVVQDIYAILAIFINGIITFLIGIALLGIAPALMSLLAAALGSFYYLVYRNTRGQLKIDGKVQSESYAKSVQMAQEAMGGIRDILIDKTQAYYLKRFDSNNRSYRLAFGRINYKAQIPRYLIESFAMALMALVVIFLSLSGQRIDLVLPILGSIALGAYRLLQPVQQCFNGFAFLQANIDPWRKIKAYLDSSERTRKSQFTYFPMRQQNRNFSTEIMLENVSFRYHENGAWVLRNLNLSIPFGSCVGFVGGTGSGKSTITDLIIGLLKPQQGQILVGGQNLNSRSNYLIDWHKSIAHVPQQIYLTDGSFIENIAFGLAAEEIDLERVIDSAKKACIHDLIVSQADGYNSVVGERGIRLSGGQRQRIGIARALYKQAKVLVLDEATSALDNCTEAAVIQSLYQLGEEITLIMIAHRISTLRNCSCIYFLEDGKVKTQGTYQQLIENSDAFRRLASISSESKLSA